MQETLCPSFRYSHQPIPTTLNIIGMKARINYSENNEILQKNRPKRNKTKINVQKLVLSANDNGKLFPKGLLNSIRNKHLLQSKKISDTVGDFRCLYNKEKGLLYRVSLTEKALIDFYKRSCIKNPLPLTNKLLKQKLAVPLKKDKDFFGDTKLSSTSMSFYPNMNHMLEHSNTNRNNNTYLVANNTSLSRATNNSIKRSQSMASFQNDKYTEKNVFQRNKRIFSLQRIQNITNSELKNLNELLKPSFKTTSHAIININAFRSQRQMKDLYRIDKNDIKTFNKNYFSTHYFEGFDFNKLKLDGYELINKTHSKKN